MTVTIEDILERHRESLRWLYPPETFCYELSCDDLWFPDPRLGIVPETGTDPISTAEYDTCVAVGADLNPDRLEVAYSHGFFPWGEAEDEVKYWHAPIARFVLFPERVHISHSMRTLLNKKRYLVSINRAFPAVIRNCGEVDGRNRQEGYWLGEEIIEVFTELYRRGKAVSVEVWDSRPDPSVEALTAAECIDPHTRDEYPADGVVPEKDWQLVGGLYGYLSNRAFLGDSMFSRVPSGSKIALIGLSQWLQEKGDCLIDLQIRTEHLESMGGEYIDYARFMNYVNPEVYRANPSLREHPCYSVQERERILCDPACLFTDPSLSILAIC